MTKREKQAWRARVKRCLSIVVSDYVWHGVLISEVDWRFGLRLVRDFRRAIRGVR